MDLYRYIPFEYFVDMIQSQELPFADPIACWPDKYEGFIYAMMKNDEWRAKIVDSIQNNKIENKVDISYWAEKMKTSGETPLRLMSWSRKGDNIIMWNAYSYNCRSVMIKTTREKINQIEYDAFGKTLNVITNLLDYIHQITLPDVLEKTFGERFSFTAAFSIKRDIYLYEEECRAIVIRDTSDKIRKISYANIPDFIEDVMVHPDADETFVGIVERFCRNNNIHFSGKSKLHEFNIEDVKTD